MNRFKEIIDELSHRRSDVLAKDLLGPAPDEASADESPSKKAPKKAEPRLRLPYSSDPEPLEQPWSN